jgi:hypothetical protein
LAMHPEIKMTGPRDSVEITLHVLNWKVVGLHVELHVIW